MKNFIRLFAFPSLLLTLLPASGRAGYKDHRGHNVDSLEAVVAAWTPQRIATAGEADYDELIRAYDGLMSGYLQINRIKSMYYARKLRELAAAKNQLRAMINADKVMGQHFWAQEQYDSAAFYYTRAMDCVERMAAGEKHFPASDSYTQETIDDARSGLYGTIGNLYNMMDSTAIAMDYYARAGEIFEKYGWNESNSVLWYNIGETWMDEGDYKQAEAAYGKSLDYARAANDSLLAANALKGLGGLYVDRGRPMRALPCLREADRYYSLHEDQEFMTRLENLGFLEKVLSEQKKNRTLLAAGALCLLLLIAVLQLLLHRIRRLRKEKDEADKVIDEAISALRPDTGQNGDPVLTDRESEILPLIAAGLTSQQIADRLCLSLPTIKWYRKRMLLKFEATNAADMVARAKEQGLI